MESNNTKFFRNVVTLVLGTSIAQALPIAITPVLTRIYTPEEFGMLAVFISIVLVLGSIANARYELAIVLPENDDDAITICALALLFSISFSIFLCIPFIFFNLEIAVLLNNLSVSFWLYFVPPIVLLIGIYNILIFMNTRLTMYKDIAKAHVYKSILLCSIQLLLGLFKTSFNGLVLGQVLSYFGSVYRLSKNINNKEIFLRISNFKKLKCTALRYKKFPIFMLPATLMNSLSGNILPIMIPILFSLPFLGFYSLAQRALGAPSALIGSSISQVYLQQASKEKNSSGNIIKVFDFTLVKLTLISTIIFFPLYFLASDLFRIIFGNDWVTAGEYAKIMMPFFAINFIVASLSMTDSVMEKQYYYTIFNFVMLIGLAIIVYHIDFLSVESLLSTVNFYLSCVYLFYLIIIRLVAQGRL